MERIAKFEKVSLVRFTEDWKKCMNPADDIRAIWQSIQLPKRATAGSAGYDFFAPVTFRLEPGESILIPTGIRAKMSDGYVLMLFPRSGLGFKYRMQLNNTVGIIDADYYHADNEGHIMCRFTNDSREGKTLTVEHGTGMVQGIFTPFGITVDDEADGKRTGGFGSTTK
jgi:dUTP pyrophosphatase